MICILAGFDDAMSFANRSRRIMPALYNSERENEQPIPPTNASGDDEEFFDDTFVDDTDQNIANADAEAAAEEEDVKPNVLTEVQLDESDVNAFDALCNTNSDTDEEEIDEESYDMNSETDPLASGGTEQNNEDDGNGAVGVVVDPSIPFNDDGQAFQDSVASVENGTGTNDESIQNGQSVQSTSNSEPTTVKFNESLEMVYSSLKDFRPYTESEFQIKANDSVCQNRPFKQNVSVLSLLLSKIERNL